MTLLSTLAQYSLVQSRIEAMLQTDDATAADIGLLLRQSRDLRDMVIDAQPRTPEEAAQKLACIVNLIRRDAQIQGFESELSALLDAAHQTCETIMAPVAAGSNRVDKRKRDTVFGGSVADYVAFSAGQLSLVDTNYRFVATSEETAQKFGRQQIALMGAHIVELIGEHRFTTRAKPRLDACFDGTPQSYHFALPGVGSAQIMRCDMRPVNSSEGPILGALVYLTDVTAQIKRLRPEQDLLICGLQKTS